METQKIVVDEDLADTATITVDISIVDQQTMAPLRKRKLKPGAKLTDVQDAKVNIAQIKWSLATTVPIDRKIAGISVAGNNVDPTKWQDRFQTSLMEVKHFYLDEPAPAYNGIAVSEEFSAWKLEGLTLDDIAQTVKDDAMNAGLTILTPVTLLNWYANSVATTTTSTFVIDANHNTFDSIELAEFASVIATSDRFLIPERQNQDVQLFRFHQYYLTKTKKLGPQMTVKVGYDAAATKTWEQVTEAAQ